MKTRKILLLSIFAFFLLIGHCFADAINPRPYVLLDPTLSSDNPPTDIQDVLDDITISGVGIDAVYDQIPNALFYPAGSGGSIASFVVEIAGYADNNQFGIYESDDKMNQLVIFEGPDSQGYQALVRFGVDSDSSLPYARVTVTDDDGLFVRQTTADNFDGSFGFYIHTQVGNTFYSEDSLNNNNPQALIIQGDNDTIIQIPTFQAGLFEDSEYIIAFEDLPFQNSDKDFQDLVVLVESIVAVPEPATMIISSLFLIGAGVYVRRKLHGKS